MKRTFYFLFLSTMIISLSGCIPPPERSSDSGSQVYTDEAPATGESTEKDNGTESSAGQDSSSETDTTTDPASLQTSLPNAGDEIAIISTPKGDITIRFFPDQAPKAVENFITHAKDGYYDGIIFHRVITDFMLQGGDPLGNGTGGESIWGEPFEDEFDANLKNIRGALSMANAGPKTNGSQFFINQVDNLYLDNKHTVFGQVIEGMDVVDAIASVEKGPGDKPLEDITMTVKIVPYEPKTE